MTAPACVPPGPFLDALRAPANAVGAHRVAPVALEGMSLASHRAPAHVFARGRTREVLVVAQRNIAASSVRFDLGWGWREHYCAAPRPVYVVPAEASARWQLDAESQCVFLALDAQPLGALLGELGVADPVECVWSLAARGFDEALVHELTERLWQAAAAGDGCTTLLADSYRVAIVHALARRAAALPRRQPLGAQPRLSRAQLRAVLAYIDAHLAEPLTVGAIAAVAGVSVFHFSRLFRESTGQAPYAFVTARRIERAAQRLHGGTEPVAEIGRALGFSSASHFARAFAARMGCAPQRYRQRCAGGARTMLAR